MKTTLIRDSTQISAFLDCPNLWKLGYSENLTLSAGRVNDPMAMGTYMHKMLEIYYKGRASGGGIANMVEKSLAFDPDKETCKCGHGKELHEIINSSETGDINVTFCVKCKCQNLDYQSFPLDELKRALCRERFRVYIYTYSNDDFIPISPDHVEVGFSYSLYEDNEKLYILEGRYDILADYKGLKTWVDHKCQMRMRDLYNKSVQFRNYDLVTEANLAFINYIRMTAKVDQTTYVRKPISFSKPEREFWRRRLIKVYDKMLHHEREGITPNDYNWGMCSGKFGYPCEFTPLCEESYVPEVVANKKSQLYHIKQEWKPW